MIEELDLFFAESCTTSSLHSDLRGVTECGLVAELNQDVPELLEILENLLFCSQSCPAFWVLNDGTGRPAHDLNVELVGGR